MTTIGVVGYGVVGKAVTQGFKEKGFKLYVNEAVLPTSRICFPKRVLLNRCDVIFICVGTPDDSAGRMEDGYLLHALNEFADIDEASPLDKLPLFVIKSTVNPGTTVAFEESYPRFKFAVNPEFLRAGTAYADFMNPDRIVMGANDNSAKAAIWSLYESWDCLKIMTSTTTAELIKHLSNAYLMSKIAFACEMQRLCQHHHIDDMELVYKGVTSDHRIHPSHLSPMIGPIPFNSHCLPKDLLALIKALNDDDVDTSYLQALFDGGVER